MGDFGEFGSPRDELIAHKGVDAASRGELPFRESGLVSSLDALAERGVVGSPGVPVENMQIKLINFI